MSTEDVVDVFTKIFAVYELILIVASVILNPLVLFICLRSKKLRRISTFKLIAFNSINDIFVCLPWNYESFTDSFFNLQTPSLSLFYCNWISNFLQTTALEFTAWMLVSISLDRLLWMTIKTWSKRYFDGLKPYVYAAFLTIFLVATNLIQGFTSGYSYVDVNGTEIINCFANLPNSIPWYTIMSEVFFYFGELAPMGILIVINVLIIYKATSYDRKQKKSTQSQTMQISRGLKRKHQMTRTILFITFLFILISLPGVVVNGFFYAEIITQYYGQLIVNIVNSVLFSFSAFNFFIVLFSNKMFANEIRKQFFRWHRTNDGSSSTIIKGQSTLNYDTYY